MKQYEQALNVVAAEHYSQLEQSLREISAQYSDPISVAQQSLDAVRTHISKLKETTVSYDFETEQEEIYFFKTIKPRFFEWLIYYAKVLQIETEKPATSRKALLKFLDREERKLQYHFDNHLDFYRYYRSGANYLDQQYFLRKRADIHIPVDPFFYDMDERFSTTHDYQVAKILASERLLDYIHSLRSHLAGSAVEDASASLLRWTASKTALIELLYALQSAGSFNDGQADIKQIASTFERMFAVDLGNYYRTFQEIRIRKSGRTNFLDQLIQRLEQRMDESDEHPKFAA